MVVIWTTRLLTLEETCVFLIIMNSTDKTTDTNRQALGEQVVFDCNPTYSYNVAHCINVADHPHGTPDPEAPYNNIEAYCTVVRSRLNSHSLGLHYDISHNF